MNEMTIVENITKNKCAVCGDKLTAWEDTYCVICSSDFDEDDFEDEED